MAQALPEGSINAAKTRLLVLIRQAEPAAHVFGDWRIGLGSVYDPKTGPKLPVVTVRISPARVVPAFYGRIWNENEYGDVGLYSFSAHCFASNCVGHCEKYKHAHDLADRIMQYLSTRDYQGSKHCPYPICDVFDLQARESEPSRGARAICRVIIEGTLLIKRVDK